MTLLTFLCIAGIVVLALGAMFDVDAEVMSLIALVVLLVSVAALAENNKPKPTPKPPVCTCCPVHGVKK